MQYRCSWTIDIEADTHEEAAALAEVLMENREGSTWWVELPLTAHGAGDNIGVDPRTGANAARGRL